MTEFDREFCLIAPACLGLFALGLATLLLPQVALRWRLTAVATFVVGMYVLFADLFESPDLAAYPIAALAAAVGVGAAVARLRFRPLAAAAALMVLGLAGGVAAYFRHDAQAIAAQQAADEEQGDVQQVERVEAMLAVTDRGRPIRLSLPKQARTRAELDRLEARRLPNFAPAGVIHHGPADDGSNCHGWVFADGKYIVASDDVDTILADNGYALVSPAGPGDLAVYRDGAGHVVHTALVRYVAPGRPPMVEGKWGWMGVYQHAADHCAYGQNFAFYHTSRDGDRLRGLTGGTPATHFTGAE